MRLLHTAFLALVALPLQAAPTHLSIMATTTTGQRNPGFLVAAEADGLIISTAPQGGNSAKLLFSNIAEVNVEEPKGWSAALARLNAGSYKEAEAEFSRYADDYAALIPWKDGYGSLARLNHLKALKGLGKFGELATAMDRQLAKPLALGELSKVDFDDLRGWALLAKADLLALQSYLNEFQDTATKPNSLQPAFKTDIPSRLIASLSYLRGHLHDKQQRPAMAMIDYSTAMTYNYGSDRAVFSMACMAALKIAAEQAAAKPGDTNLQRTARSLALTYKDCVGKGKVPAEFASLAEAPAAPPAPAAPAK